MALNNGTYNLYHLNKKGELERDRNGRIVITTVRDEEVSFDDEPIETDEPVIPCQLQQTTFNYQSEQPDSSPFSFESFPKDKKVEQSSAEQFGFGNNYNFGFDADNQLQDESFTNEFIFENCF